MEDEFGIAYVQSSNRSFKCGKDIIEANNKIRAVYLY